MPIVNGKYQAPTWVNNSSPAIDATELQAISDSIANALSDEDIGKIWVWDKGTGTPAYVVNNDSNYADSNVSIGDSTSTTGSITITYFDSAVVSDSGTYGFSGEHSVSGSYNNYTAFNVLKGKYYIHWVDDDISIPSYIPSTATITRYDAGGSGYRYQIHASTVYEVYGVASTFSHVDYVSDTSSSAYPVDGTSGGYYYKRLGQVGGALDKNARLESGLYVGTGTYGAENPISITFGFRPKIVILGSTSTIYNNVAFIDALTSSYTQPGYGLMWTQSSGRPTSAKIDGLTLSWYCDGGGVTGQFNMSGTTYRYIAIG